MASLKANPSYQLLIKELDGVKRSLEDEIFNERTTDERRKQCVMKRNAVVMFQELPDDLINDEEINK